MDRRVVQPEECEPASAKKRVSKALSCRRLKTSRQSVSVAALRLGEEANAWADQTTDSMSFAPVPASAKCSFSGR